MGSGWDLAIFFIGTPSKCVLMLCVGCVCMCVVCVWWGGVGGIWLLAHLDSYQPYLYPPTGGSWDPWGGPLTR